MVESRADEDADRRQPVATLPGGDRRRRTGMLADSLEDWVRQLTELVDDAGLRHRIGHAAREQALLNLSPAQQGYRYLKILHRAREAVAERGHRPLFRTGNQRCFPSPTSFRHPTRTCRPRTWPSVRIEPDQRRRPWQSVAAPHRD